MSRLRSRRVRAVVLWTAAMFVLAVVVSVNAIAGLYGAQQRCFFESGVVPCPAGDDPRVAHLTFGLIGVPLVWVVGVVIGTLAWALKRHRDPPGGRGRDS